MNSSPRCWESTSRRILGHVSCRWCLGCRATPDVPRGEALLRAAQSCPRTASSDPGHEAERLNLGVLGESSDHRSRGLGAATEARIRVDPPEIHADPLFCHPGATKRLFWHPWDRKRPSATVQGENGCHDGPPDLGLRPARSRRRWPLPRVGLLCQVRTPYPWVAAPAWGRHGLVEAAGLSAGRASLQPGGDVGR